MGDDMRNLNKNKQRMYYSLQLGETPIYETDENGNIIYIDVDGEQKPLETGETRLTYSEPVEFYGSISMSGGESETVEFGLNLADYSAVLVTEKNRIPIDETSVIWHESAPTFDESGYVDQYGADYTVVKVSPSLNEDKYVLQKVVKEMRDGA